MGKKHTIPFFLILIAAAILAGDMFAQDAAPVDDSAGDADISGGLDVKAELERERRQREEAKKELDEKILEYQTEIDKIDARKRELESEVPTLERQIADAKRKKQAAYVTLSTVGAEYTGAEDDAREAHHDKTINEFQDLYDQRFDAQKKEHDAHMGFIAENRWKRSDIENLSLVMDADLPSRAVKFGGSGSDRLSGTFPTVDFASGDYLWHKLPSSATFSVAVTKDNPFVADISVHPGYDSFEIGSTNTFDWDIHIYIAKHFRDLETRADRFELVGVAWPVDITRKTCKQLIEPPIFFPTSMPVHTNVVDEIPEVTAVLDAWVFEDLGLKQKLEDAEMGVKTATQIVKVQERMLPKIRARVQRKLAKLSEKRKEIEEDLDEHERMRKEYDEMADPLDGGGDDGFGGDDEAPEGGDSEGPGDEW